MKKLSTLSLLLLFISQINTAQQQQNQSNSYSSILYSNPKKMQFTYDSIKEVINALPDSLSNNRESKELNRDYNFWSKRMLVENGEPVVGGEKYSKMLNTYLNNPICAPNENYGKNYDYYQPLYGATDNNGDILQVAGWVQAVYADPNNHNFIMAGSRSGGLFLTEDGGANWRNVTDNLVSAGVGINSIVRDIDNPNIFYAATNRFVGDVNFGIGLIKSTDNGNT